jgi:pimeloyl-ACP methyl ester carboxylesterase
MATILLIPGLICDGHVWAATQAALPESVVADVTRQTSITEMAQDLLASHPGRLIVIGHSMGGRVAMEMAHLAPDRITGLGLLNTGMHPKKPGEDAKREAMIALAHDEGMEVLASKWLPGMMAEGIVPDPAVLEGLKSMVLRMSPDIHERQMRALLARPDASQTMGQYSGPLLLLVGRQDQWSPVAQHQDIQHLCPQAELAIIENAGHFAPVEQPVATAETLAKWARNLTTHPSSEGAPS